MIAVLICVRGNRPELLLIGVALLQSVTPVALALMSQALPRQPATAAGMALGLAIVVGGAPLMSGLTAFATAPMAILVAALLSGMIMWIRRICSGAF